MRSIFLCPRAAGGRVTRAIRTNPTSQQKNLHQPIQRSTKKTVVRNATLRPSPSEPGRYSAHRLRMAGSRDVQRRGGDAIGRAGSGERCADAAKPGGASGTASTPGTDEGTEDRTGNTAGSYRRWRARSGERESPRSGAGDQTIAGTRGSRILPICRHCSHEQTPDLRAIRASPARLWGHELQHPRR